MTTIVLTLEYDGTGLCGWQKQPNQPSIEQAVLDAIYAISREHVEVSVAGRTDAGVHAQGQVASFSTQYNIPPKRWAGALNAYLPNHIRVHQSVVRENFNARYDSIAKRYRYRVYNGPHYPPLVANTSWHIRKELDISSMKEAAQFLIGEHDFEAFRTVHCDAPHAIRHIYSIAITQEARAPIGRMVDIVFHGNAFCRHMCRILAGTLIEVGQGKRSVQSVDEVLQSRDRTLGGMTAPPQGLTLLEVEYP